MAERSGPGGTLKPILFFGALATLPWLIAGVLYFLPAGRRLAVAGLVLSLTVIVDVNLVSDLNYRGMSNALDLGTIDILGFGLLVFVLLDRRRRGYRLLPQNRPPTPSPVVIAPTLTLVFSIFLAFNAVSLVGADSVVYGMLDFAKLLRGFALFWIAANILVDDGMAGALPLFMSLFVAVEVLAAAKDYMGGVYWVNATFAHKNAFAFAMNTMLPFLLARALVRPRRRVWFLALFTAGAVAVILSRSRTAWLTMAIGTAIVVVMCLLAAARHGTRRDLARMVALLFAMFALALPLGVKLADGIIGRWDESAVASAEFRSVNNGVALEMANAHPLGVGTNNYVENLSTPVGDPLPEVDRTVAHNVYLYLAAEIGWVGLSSYLAILLAFGILAARMYRHANSLRAIYVSAGAMAALISSTLHSTMESGTMLRRHTYFVWCIVMGLVVSVAQREGPRRLSLIAWLVRIRDRRFGLDRRGHRA